MFSLLETSHKVNMEYKICKRCIMSEKGDNTIQFDEKGYCNYCNQATRDMNNLYFPNEQGKSKLEAMLQLIRDKNKDKKYDCVMGISGGLDSCYLAYLGAVKWGLRIAAVHIDDGFDTPECKENVRKLCEKCNIDLHIVKPNYKQFIGLCKAYMRAGVPNLAVPQDNVLFSCIFQFAKENQIQYFLSGGNFSLECILQKGNTYSPFDLENIKDINAKFGECSIEQLPLLSYEERKQEMKNIIEYRPLNYIEYTRNSAIEELQKFFGFEYYGAKHLENYFTAFLQLYWMPKKFDVDKRRSHLSSMIITNQMTRDEAIEQLKEPLYQEKWMKDVVSIIKNKLNISDIEYDKIMLNDIHQHDFYKIDPVVQFENRKNKFKMYYQILNKWLALKQQGRGLTEYFQRNNYRNIAIYGMGELGKRLYEELKDTEITVKFCVDKDIIIVEGRTVLYASDCETEEVDAVIVTPVAEFYDIKQKLKQKNNYPIISLEKVVFSL